MSQRNASAMQLQLLQLPHRYCSATAWSAAAAAHAAVLGCRALCQLTESRTVAHYEQSCDFFRPQCSQQCSRNASVRCFACPDISKPQASKHECEGPNRNFPLAHGHDSDEGAAQGGLEGPQSSQEESRCSANEIQVHTQENRRYQVADGRADEGGGLLPGRGQVHQRGLQPGGAAERHARTGQGALAQGQRGRGDPAHLRVLPGGHGHERAGGAGAGRPEAGQAEEELLRGGQAARRAGLAADLLCHPRQRHQDHQPARQRHRVCDHPAHRAHPTVHHDGAGREGARGVLPAEEDPGEEEAAEGAPGTGDGRAECPHGRHRCAGARRARPQHPGRRPGRGHPLCLRAAAIKAGLQEFSGPVGFYGWPGFCRNSR